MKIFIISRGYPTEESPANGVFEFDQARALADAGQEVYFLSVDIRSFKRTRKWGYASFDRDGVHVRGINVPIGPLPLKYRIPIGCHFYALLLKRVLKEVGQPDVVHAHFADQGQYVLSRRDWLDCPFVYTEHASGVLLGRGDYLSFAPQIWKSANSVLAVSGTLAREIERLSNVKSQVVWNVINTGIFSSVRLRQHDAYAFVSAGNLIPGKNFASLIRAFAMTSKRTDKALKLVVFGEGNERDSLENLINELGVQESVFLRGMCAREEMAREYSNADCFALASRCETFGVAYAEAMAAGLPVIATRCGGPEDFVNSNCGLLVETDDDEAMAEAMADMVSNSKSRYSPSAIRAQVESSFAPEVIAGELIDVYKRQVEGWLAKRKPAV